MQDSIGFTIRVGRICTRHCPHSIDVATSGVAIVLDVSKGAQYLQHTVGCPPLPTQIETGFLKKPSFSLLNGTHIKVYTTLPGSTLEAPESFRIRLLKYLIFAKWFQQLE